MDKVHRDYWQAFNHVGNETLHQHGFSFELLPEREGSPTLFRIKLNRQGHQYLLSFSSHHLDFQEGVSIEEDGRLVLPAPELKRIGEGLYGYTDQSIKRMIDDLCRLKTNLMDEEPLYSISWTDFITKEPRSLKIWGNVDKTDSQVYYTCLLNSQTIVVTNVNYQWMDNSGKENAMAVNLGRLLESCDFLLKIGDESN